MPTILVADDNSNIQKMVTLAVKDLGVDVVSVSNGEAAVRKFAQMLPDLVLADTFMPVRNGYEVCEYVKHDSRLAHIPVVLLTGAFDPFDEKEAQRVGADGVLKKPFVPTDPLLAMVKTLLSRAPVPVAVAAGSAAAVADELSPPAVSAVPNVIVMPVPAHPQSEREEEMIQEEPTEDHLAAQPAPHIDDERPPVFSGLYTPAEEKAASEANVESPGEEAALPSWHHAPSVDTSLRGPAEEEEPQERAWEQEAPKLERGEEAGYLRDSESEESLHARPAIESAALGVETSLPAGSAPVVEEPAQEVTPAPVPGKVWFAEEQNQAPAAVAPEEIDSFVAPPAEVAEETPTAEEETSSAPVVHGFFAPTELATAPAEPELPPAALAESEFSADAMDSVSAAVPPAVESVPPAPFGTSSEEKSHLSAAAEPAEVSSWAMPPQPDPLLVESIVNTVIERMQPQILDIVTREILRPVIEAIVRSEFERK